MRSPFLLWERRTMAEAGRGFLEEMRKKMREKRSEWGFSSREEAEREEWNDGCFVRPTYCWKGGGFVIWRLIGHYCGATTGVPPSPTAAPNCNLVHRTWNKTVDEPHVGQRGPVKCVAISCADWPCLSCYANTTGAAYHLVLLLGESRLYWSKKIRTELPSPSRFLDVSVYRVCT